MTVETPVAWDEGEAHLWFEVYPSCEAIAIQEDETEIERLRYALQKAVCTHVGCPDEIREQVE
jgi:hypothetical protein